MPLPATDTVKAQLMGAADVDRTLNRLSRQIVEHLDDEAEPAERLALVGMQTRGVHLARRLRDKIEAIEGVRLPFGVLDATLYRDDFRQRLRQPAVQPTDIPFDVYDRRLVLVDDVIYTGRSTRAALDALMDLGRPASVRFLAFIDRGLRELPVCPDFIGRTVPTAPGEEVRVRLSEIDGEDAVYLVAGSGYGVQGTEGA
ncbi:MAG: bifunctional pyr operon transcriptional regulator/uracil phosphoribosyltransferase PyrR [Rhodothermaceae bacterium]|nr:bifunctional pyr operon transcriptional regulator/uracil phosphoribosyltransferase PyrR [Rhodothermaceae bacterium]